MRNIKLTIEYDGKKYAGWQAQNIRKSKAASRKVRTIQETMEKAIQKILHERIRLIVSGRTDAGVHAFGQVANFKTDSGISVKKLSLALNAVLPDDISVIKAEETDADFHSRFSVKSKVYRYVILNRPSRPAVLRDMIYFFSHPLDLNIMRKEAKALLGRHNFKSFQAADKKERNAFRTIKDLNITRENGLIYIDIEGDGFLYNMIRNIVGTLIEAGRGKFPRGSMRKILLAKNRKLAGPTVPAKGLCLMRVKY